MLGSRETYEERVSRNLFERSLARKEGVAELEGKLKPNEVLASWGYGAECSGLMGDDQAELLELSTSEAGKYIDIVGNVFGDDCAIYLSVDVINAANTLGKIQITNLGPKLLNNNLKICIMKNMAGLRINIGGSNNYIYVGKFGYAFNSDINIWDNSRVFIGDRATCNGSRIILSNSTVIVGYDSMFSNEIILQSSDQHGIVSLDNMTIINDDHKTIRIGKHTWVGRRSMIMPGCTIGDGSIIGAGAIVTSNIDKCSVCVGVPAKVIKTNISWSRDASKISEDEMLIFGSIS